MKYHEYNDHELLHYISESNEDASNIMFDKYNPLIVTTATRLFKYCKGLGLELSDLIQEGRLGLNAAILSFNEEKDNIFYTFAKKCIESRIISLVVSAKRQKHRLLNESLSLNDKYDDNTFELEDYLGDNSYNPEYRFMEHEAEEELIKSFSKKLTNFEEEVFLLKISGLNYKEISNILDKDIKAVDNALQRIKIKLRQYIDAKVDK